MNKENELRMEITRLINERLTENEILVLHKRAENVTVKTVAEQLALSDTRIRQIETYAVRKLKRIAQNLEVSSLTVYSVFFKICTVSFPEFYALEVLHEDSLRKIKDQQTEVTTGLNSLYRLEARASAAQKQYEQVLSNIPDLDLLRQGEKIIEPFMKKMKDYETLLGHLENEHRHFWLEQADRFERHIDACVARKVNEVLQKKFGELTEKL
mgnify:CR=1 FL=1